MFYSTEDINLDLFCRMDDDQSARRITREQFNIQDPDYYEFEAHVLFDDAIDIDTKIPNEHVKRLVNVVEEAAR